MAEAALAAAREWLTKAQHDLGSARKLATEPDPYLDTAIYHCQQAAEKAVKGWLVLREVPFERTHNIRDLVVTAASSERGFLALLDAAQALTPYATAYRYPDEVLEPDAAEFSEALEHAERIHAYVSYLMAQA